MTGAARKLAHPIVRAIEAAEIVSSDAAPEVLGGKPRLLVQHASPDLTVAALRDILAACGGLFDRGTPVRLYHDAGEALMKAQHLRGDDLVLHAHRVCRPFAVKLDKQGEAREEDARLPRAVAEMYLGWHGEWRLPVLNGLARSPLLHEDGSLHAATGYDPVTGIWCEAAPGLGGLLPEQPSRSDAAAALRTIRQTFRTFCFADAKMVYDATIGVDVVDLDSPPGLDESTFLAALLTAICRASLAQAPGLLVRAAPMSGAGAGKGLLVRCIALIAFGREPQAVSGGSTREELEKRIGAELIEAGPILFLDNLNNRTFKSDLLASVITERPTRVRILGRSQMVALNSSALVVLTGNGLLLSEDLARRFIVIELDPRTEDPESRPFTTDIKATCRENRGELLAAALTIWRWGRLSPELVSGAPLGGFSRWSRWVRDPLLALGCQDPVARIGETKSRDSERDAISEIFDVWWRIHGDRAVALRELHQEVRQAIDPAGRGRQWTAARLEKLSGTRIAGFRLTRQPAASKSGVTVYALKRTDGVKEHQDHRDHQGPAPNRTALSGPDGLDGLDGFASAAASEADRSRRSASITSTSPKGPEGVRGPGRHQDHRDHPGPSGLERVSSRADTDPPRPPDACRGGHAIEGAEPVARWRGRV